MKIVKEILILLILLVVFSVSVLLLWTFTSLLDFFPWGNSRAYVIWEPLVQDSIVPPMISIGCLMMIVSGKHKRLLRIGFHIFILGLSLTLPSNFGFDLQTDFNGRWCGVIVTLLGSILTMVDIANTVKEIKIVRAREAKSSTLNGNENIQS